jgi:hypothetical protein
MNVGAVHCVLYGLEMIQRARQLAFKFGVRRAKALLRVCRGSCCVEPAAGIMRSLCAMCSMHARCGILMSNAQHVCAVWSFCAAFVCAASYCYPLIIVGAMCICVLCAACMLGAAYL